MMTIKQLLIEAGAIQVGVQETDWKKVIELAARPLRRKRLYSRILLSGGDQQHVGPWGLLRIRRRHCPFPMRAQNAA
jgi:hypothetical protein